MFVQFHTTLQNKAQTDTMLPLPRNRRVGGPLAKVFKRTRISRTKRSSITMNEKKKREKHNNVKTCKINYKTHTKKDVNTTENHSVLALGYGLYK